MSEKIIKNMSLGVIIYALAYMLLTLIYCLPRILAEYSSLDVSHLTENFKFPIEIFSWGLLAICAGYSGVDVGFKGKIKSTSSSEIKKDKVLQVIILLILILLESTIFNLFIGHDFISVNEFGKQVFKGIELPLEGISTALVSTIVIYITGNQIAMSNEKSTEEKTE